MHPVQPPSSRRRRWCALVAGAALAVGTPALLGVSPASASLTGPGVGPNKNITVFHNLDFVGVFGYGTFGSTVRVEVIRDGALIGVAAGPAVSTPEGLGLEVNHGLETGTPGPGTAGPAGRRTSGPATGSW